MDLNGTVIWSKSFITDSSFYLREMIQTMDSSIYVVGESSDDPQYGVLLKLNPDGQLAWSKKYLGVSFADIDADSSHLYISWSLEENFIRERGMLKLDMNGNFVKRVKFNSGVQSYKGISTTQRSNGNLVSTTVDFTFELSYGYYEITNNLDYVSVYEALMMMNELVTIQNKGVYAIGFGPIYGVKAGNVEMGVVRMDSTMNVSNDWICAYPIGVHHHLYFWLLFDNAKYSSIQTADCFKCRSRSNLWNLRQYEYYVGCEYTDDRYRIVECGFWIRCGHSSIQSELDHHWTCSRNDDNCEMDDHKWTMYFSRPNGYQYLNLPVELAEFDAKVINNETVEIDWMTATEQDNDYFLVQRSSDMHNWEVIDQVDGARNSAEPIYYRAIDASPELGVSYYRLPQVDFNRDESFSGIKAVEIFASGDIQVYPNPTNGDVFVEGNEFELGTLHIFDLYGKELKVEKVYSSGKCRLLMADLPGGSVLCSFPKSLAKGD